MEWWSNGEIRYGRRKISRCARNDNLGLSIADRSSVISNPSAALRINSVRDLSGDSESFLGAISRR
jgi:hypothetical protein